MNRYNGLILRAFPSPFSGACPPHATREGAAIRICHSPRESLIELTIYGPGHIDRTNEVLARVTLSRTDLMLVLDRLEEKALSEDQQLGLAYPFAGPRAPERQRCDKCNGRMEQHNSDDSGSFWFCKDHGLFWIPE